MAAERFQHIPLIAAAAPLHPLNKIHIKNPVYQVIFVPEMIIKAFPVHAAILADISYADFGKRLFLHQLLHRYGQCIFGNVGIRHLNLRIKAASITTAL